MECSRWSWRAKLTENARRVFLSHAASPSGIADYSQALLEHLKRLVEVEVFSDASRAFHPEEFDLALYQVGNNPHHAFVYETVLQHPGVVVMHESNLHHLIADLTIKRGDWDAYAFVDLCQEQADRPSSDHQVQTLKAIQEIEFDSLLAHLLAG